mgnify:CR=1 FL=1
MADPTTFQDAYNVLKNHELLGRIPASVRRQIELGLAGRAGETPKRLDNCDNYIIGDVTVAMEAMALSAKTMGLKPLIGSAEVMGEVEKVAIDKAFEVAGGSYRGCNALFFGGETTPKLPASPPMTMFHQVRRFSHTV